MTLERSGTIRTSAAEVPDAHPSAFVLRAAELSGPGHARHIAPVPVKVVDRVQQLTNHLVYGWQGTLKASGERSANKKTCDWQRRGDPFEYVTKDWLDGGPRIHKSEAAVDDEVEEEDFEFGNSTSSKKEEERLRLDQEYW